MQPMPPAQSYYAAQPAYGAPQQPQYGAPVYPSAAASIRGSRISRPAPVRGSGRCYACRTAAGNRNHRPTASRHEGRLADRPRGPHHGQFAAILSLGVPDEDCGTAREVPGSTRDPRAPCRHEARPGLRLCHHLDAAPDHESSIGLSTVLGGTRSLRRGSERQRRSGSTR